MAKAKSDKADTMAARADRHVLYEGSVQDPESELEFVSETFEALTGRPLKSIREDFCGTAHTACHWVGLGREHRAVGVDLDADTLDWGREHHVARLGRGARARIRLIHGDVLDVETEAVDAVLAMNFSYYLFTTRDRLRRYFEAARSALKADGILFLDAFGGYEAHQELEERTEYDEYTYVWDQSAFNPIDQHMTCRSGRCPKCASCCWRPVSRRQPSTGRAPTRKPAKATASTVRASKATPMPGGSPTSSRVADDRPRAGGRGAMGPRAGQRAKTASSQSSRPV
jgi:SAM-dependent methyltransferase